MGFPDLPLGQRMHSFGVVLRGGERIEHDGWLSLLEDIAAAIGMSAAGSPAAWSYPTDGGKGGKGLTILLPITESFLALDTWPDHRGAYLFVCSCRAFDEEAIDEVALSHGLASDGRFAAELNLT